MRVESKQDFIDSIDESWMTLWETVENIDLSKRDLRPYVDGIAIWSVKDILSHLYGWHKLLIQWSATEQGLEIEIPAKGYKWNQTPELNQKIFEDWKDTQYRSICRRLKLSHNRLRKNVLDLSEAELLKSGHFAWTKKHAIVSYIAPNTTSHYKWAVKKIKRLKKLFAG